MYWLAVKSKGYFTLQLVVQLQVSVQLYFPYYVHKFVLIITNNIRCI